MNEAALQEVLRKLGRISAGPSATGTGHQATTALPESTATRVTRAGSTDKESAQWELVPPEAVLGPPTEDESDVAEAYWERAAIKEFDGRLNRDEAERLAARDAEVIQRMEDAKLAQAGEDRTGRMDEDVAGRERPPRVGIIGERLKKALPVEDTRFILDHGFEAYEQEKRRQGVAMHENPDKGQKWA